jgi:hypothetical protein
MTFTILHEDGEAAVEARAIPVDRLAEVTGWQLKPEGLCRGEVCVPVRDTDALVADGAIDIAALAEALHRPVVVDPVGEIAALGVDPIAVGSQLRDRAASDFTLPTLAGDQFAFSSIGRKKKVLIAWASW